MRIAAWLLLLSGCASQATVTPAMRPVPPRYASTQPTPLPEFSPGPEVTQAGQTNAAVTAQLQSVVNIASPLAVILLTIFASATAWLSHRRELWRIWTQGKGRDK